MKPKSLDRRGDINTVSHNDLPRLDAISADITAKPTAEEARRMVNQFRLCVGRPAKTCEIKKSCGIRFFDCDIATVRGIDKSNKQFFLGLHIDKSDMEMVEKMSAQGPGGFFGPLFAYTLCRYFDESPDGERVLLVEVNQSKTFSKLGELAKEGVGDAQALGAKYWDWAKMQVLAVNKLGSQIGADRIYHIDQFTAEERTNKIFGTTMNLPKRLGRHAYETVPEELGYSRWLGLGQKGGNETRFNIVEDFFMSRGWVKKPDVLTESDRQFRARLI